MRHIVKSVAIGYHLVKPVSWHVVVSSSEPTNWDTSPIQVNSQHEDHDSVCRVSLVKLCYLGEGGSHGNLDKNLWQKCAVSQPAEALPSLAVVATCSSPFLCFGLRAMLGHGPSLKESWQIAIRSPLWGVLSCCRLLSSSRWRTGSRCCLLDPFLYTFTTRRISFHWQIAFIQQSICDRFGWMFSWCCTWWYLKKAKSIKKKTDPKKIARLLKRCHDDGSLLSNQDFMQCHM